MQLEYFKTKDAFLSYVKGVSKRVLIENLISSVDLKNNRWYYLGYCQVCESARKFLVDWKYSDKININFRERLVCEFCKLNNRQRFMAKYLKDEYLKIKDSKIIIYLYEQV